MKKRFLILALVALFGFAPGVSAQAPSPMSSGADFLSRQNTYNSWRMNATMNSGNRSRSRRRKKVVRRTKRRHYSGKSRYRARKR